MLKINVFEVIYYLIFVYYVGQFVYYVGQMFNSYSYNIKCLIFIYLNILLNNILWNNIKQYKIYVFNIYIIYQNVLI